MKQEPRVFLSGRSAAKILGITPPVLIDRIASGKLKPFGRLDNGTYIFEPDYIEIQAVEQPNRRPAKRVAAA